jgi:hypothetical protein
MTATIKRVFPKIASSRRVPDEIKATIGKLARDPHGTARGSQNIRIPDQRVLSHVANKTIASINDARNMFQVLPDMDYARQIIVSATISPGDLTDTKVIYSVNNDDLDTNLTGPMLREVQSFFDDTYRITKLLPKILNDVLFEKGSYPILIMPESSIDQIINTDQYKGASLEAAVVSLENHLKEEVGQDGVYVPWGALGFPSQVKGQAGVSFESLKVEEYAKYSHVAFPSMESNDSKNIARKSACDALNLIAGKHDKNFVVTDNANILKRPMVLETKRKLSIRRIYGGKLRGGLNRTARPTQPASAKPLTGATVRYDGKSVSLSASSESAPSMEASSDKKMSTLNEVESAFYSQRRYKHIPVQPVLTKTQVGADTYGHPVVMHLSPESVIPIHVPGNPAEHVAYFVLLDINGNPLNVTAHDNYYDDIRNQLNGNDQFSSQVLQTARRGHEGQGTLNNEIIEEMTRIHSETIESDLLSRLRAGVMEGEYNISRTDHINQVMFSRHLKGQKTIMLYVPAEMLTYIAFEYNEYGVGKSLLEDAKILGSIRAALMLSNTLATINNAAGGKTITITLDPKDENPAETVEFLLSEHAKVNSEGFARIIGQTHPLGLADQIQNHGVNVVVEGNTRYPETKFDVSSRDGTARTIDSEIEKTFRDRHFQVFGLSAEMADGINEADFATTVVQKNLMLLKRVIQNQDKLEPFLCDFVRQYSLNSGILLDLLRDIVSENKKYLVKGERDSAGIDEFIHEFLMALEVSLPRPEINDIAKQMEAYDAYTAGLEKIIDAHLSEEMFITDANVGVEDILPAVKKNVMAEFQRRWLRQRNIMSEVDIFSTMDEDDAPSFNFMEVSEKHMEGLTNTLMKYMKSALKGKEKKAAKIAEIEKLKELANNPGGTDGLDGTGELGDDGLGDPNAELGDVTDPNALGGDGLDDGTGVDDGLGLDDPNAELGLDADPNADPALAESADGLDATDPLAEPGVDDAAAAAEPGADAEVDAFAAPADVEAPADDLAAVDAEVPAVDNAAIPEVDAEVPPVEDVPIPDADAAPAAEVPPADDLDLGTDTPLPDVAEEPPADDAPVVEEPPAEPDAEVPDVEVPDVEAPPAEEPPAEEPEAVAEETPVEPVVEEPPVEPEPPVEEEPAPDAEPVEPEVPAEEKELPEEHQETVDAAAALSTMTEPDEPMPDDADLASNVEIPDAKELDDADKAATAEEKAKKEKEEKDKDKDE